MPPRSIFNAPYWVMLKEAEKRILAGALKEANGHGAQAAKLLGLAKSVFWRRALAHGLEFKKGELPKNFLSKTFMKNTSAYPPWPPKGNQGQPRKTDGDIDDADETSGVRSEDTGGVELDGEPGIRDPGDAEGHPPGGEEVQPAAGDRGQLLDRDGDA